MTSFQAGKEGDALKKDIVFIFCIISLLAGISLCTASAAQDVPTFSNKDLERYKRPSDEIPFPATGQPVAKRRTTGKDQQQEKNYWCSKAQAYQTKIDRARDRVEDVAKLASDESGGTAFCESRLKKPTRRKCERAKKDLKEAERELQYLQEDARREDVPPGWLRCQFE
jgi:hypothetical protein